jgi:hypothetical protein
MSMEPSSTLEVDGVEYPVHFQDFHQPLHVWLRSGEHVSLRPWTCAEHLRALGSCLRPGGEGVALDEHAFCGEVLARSGLDHAQEEELAPLVLWWTAGGGTPEVHMSMDGWLELASCRVRLRTWTYGERSRALNRCTRTRPEGGQSFDAGAYLAAMVDASVCEVVPAGVRVEELDAASTVALLDAVVMLNIPNGELTEQTVASEEEVATMLRLCRELRWTPSQVWTTPAPEVDRLLQLLDREREGAQSPPEPAPVPRGPASTPRMADFPDAVVIQIEDESA